MIRKPEWERQSIEGHWDRRRNPGGCYRSRKTCCEPKETLEEKKETAKAGEGGREGGREEQRDRQRRKQKGDKGGETERQTQRQKRMLGGGRCTRLDSTDTAEP